jgi:hypothetical protein
VILKFFLLEMLCERGGGREIKYFPPTRDDNTWKKQGVREHVGEYKYEEIDIDRLEKRWTQILAPHFPLLP